jgi:hypothetical protein
VPYGADATTCSRFFDHHASNGHTEAINGRLEALRRNTLRFRKLNQPNPLTTALRRTPTRHQRTLNYEEPVYRWVQVAA